MTMHTHDTAKSRVFTFDGFNERLGAYVQGAFFGKFIVPLRYAHLIHLHPGYELEDLREMHSERRFGIRLVNSGRVQ